MSPTLVVVLMGFVVGLVIGTLVAWAATAGNFKR